MTSIITNEFALHFGVYPNADGALSIVGHSDPEVEHEIDLTFGGTAGAPPTGLRAFISGSWGCWGPADQSSYDAKGSLVEASEGDRSLHVVFTMPSGMDPFAAESVLRVWDVLRTITVGRLLDYAVTTDQGDWSAQQGVVLFRGNPYVSILPTSPSIGAVHRPDVLNVIDEDPDDLDRVLNGEK